MSKLEYVFPLIKTILVNRNIDKKSKTLKGAFKANCIKQKKILKNSGLSTEQILKISHDLYNDENNRTSNIENKDSRLLIGVGISTSLLSIIAGFSFEDELSLSHMFAIVLLICSISNLVISGIGVHCATRISERYVLTTSNLNAIITNKKNIITWAAQQLVAVEYNYDLIRKKSNYIDMSQQHFIRGIVLMMLGFIFLLCEPLFIILNSITSFFF
ncbi:MAG: hypothetical protein OXC46_08585 [Thaumarchaeota archaeon]|nr:hypothetical protein [Nitrososphaerota archaeon]